ncbi:hypothetical protein Ciccas_001546 [Cichlidogyrus casuarinus]|uniref:deoxyribose-phosphate aldolase n=1 Tax=Cichlidogyrus casuarinus TaxID=1844966 RepID=A0ABD2QK11_9PLAT
MISLNKIRALDLSQVKSRNWLSHSVVNIANAYTKNIDFDINNEVYWLLKAISLIDLTTLAGDDTSSNVERLVLRALNPISKTTLQLLKDDFDIDVEGLGITTAAICVYPSRVRDAKNCFSRIRAALPIAAVATGFPSGQYPLETRLEEIRYAVKEGAQEIDIVINRSLVLDGDWQTMYNEVCQMREACGSAHLKTILAVGELETYKNIYIASMVCMMAGADFIKTSTGKETTINATLPVTYVMCCAIRDFQRMYNFKVGYKPAGGLKTFTDALKYLVLIKNVLGNEWLNSDLLRFGASSLLNSLDERLFTLASNRNPLSGELSSF